MGRMPSEKRVQQEDRSVRRESSEKNVQREEVLMRRKSDEAPDEWLPMNIFKILRMAPYGVKGLGTR